MSTFLCFCACVCDFTSLASDYTHCILCLSLGVNWANPITARRRRRYHGVFDPPPRIPPDGMCFEAGVGHFDEESSLSLVSYIRPSTHTKALTSRQEFSRSGIFGSQGSRRPPGLLSFQRALRSDIRSRSFVRGLGTTNLSGTRLKRSRKTKRTRIRQGQVTSLK